MNQKIFNKVGGGVIIILLAKLAIQPFTLLETYVKYYNTALNSKSTLPFV